MYDKNANTDIFQETIHSNYIGNVVQNIKESDGCLMMAECGRNMQNNAIYATITAEEGMVMTIRTETVPLTHAISIRHESTRSDT